MVQCPQCQTEIDQEFGMVNCPNCKAVFMIDFSGETRMADDSPTPTPTEDKTPNFDLGVATGDIEVFDANTSAFPDEIPDDDYTRTAVDEIASEILEPMDDEGAEPDDFVDEPQEPITDPQISQEDEQRWEASEMPVPATDVDDINDIKDDGMAEEPALQPRASKTPVDVSEFGNSEESLLEDGEYVYDLQIDRIDSKDIRETIKYVLEDDKLKIDDTMVESDMRNGRLKLKNLHPLKAKRIVEQLQYYDIDIHWNQRNVHVDDAHE